MIEEMQAETVSEADTIHKLTDALLEREQGLRRVATRRLGGPTPWVVHRFDRFGYQRCIICRVLILCSSCIFSLFPSFTLRCVKRVRSA